MKRLIFDPQAKRNFRFVVEYDGTNYHGWQRQKGFITIQEVIEARLEIMLGQRVGIHGSGRTDSGVHARGQVFSFATRTRLKADEFHRGLNSLLPDDVAILRAEEVDTSFHARFSARSKTYEYRILNRELPSPLERLYVWHIRRPLEREPMRECLRELIGEHDFAAFTASGCAANSTRRTMIEAELIEPDPDRIHFRFRATGFLKHMVRNLVGTLVDVGVGRTQPDDFRNIFSGKDRRRAGMTAPAHGLFLMEVEY